MLRAAGAGCQARDRVAVILKRDQVVDNCQALGTADAHLPDYCATTFVIRSFVEELESLTHTASSWW